MVINSFQKLWKEIILGDCCIDENCGNYDKKPVCDSNHQTHGNICHFRKAKCIYDKLHPHIPLKLDYEGKDMKLNSKF